jgi:uncharacterized delta-60 repeat protein
MVTVSVPLDLYSPLVAPDFTDAARAPNGTIVASGESGLQRFNANGGSRPLAGGDDPSQLQAVAIQPNGKIVTVGNYVYYDSEYGDFLVQRYNPDGTPDDTFGTDGEVLTDFGGHVDAATSVALQPDGKIVVAGYTAQTDSEDAPATDFAVARYDPDGTLDPTFSGDGKQTTDLAGIDIANGLAIQANGKIVIGGSADGDLAAARYMPNGAPDASFSGDGVTRAGFIDPNGLGGQAVALQPNGRIVVAGGQNGEFTLARFSAHGSLDQSFSGDGTVVADFPHSQFYLRPAAYDVIVQGDRILAAGNADGEFALARFLPNGALDRSFSGDGMVTTEFGTDATDFNTDDWALAIVPEPNGVLVAGSSLYYAPKYYDDRLWGALARYRTDDGPADADADGVLDSSDLCPNIFSARADGCRFYRRSLDIEVRKYPGRLYLKISATSLPACLGGATLEVYKLRDGRRKQIRAVELGTPGYRNSEDRYNTMVRKTRGRVYAQIDESVVPAWGRCGRATSDVIPLRHP